MRAFPKKKKINIFAINKTRLDILFLPTRLSTCDTGQYDQIQGFLSSKILVE